MTTIVAGSPYKQQVSLNDNSVFNPSVGYSQFMITIVCFKTIALDTKRQEHMIE